MRRMAGLLLLSAAVAIGMSMTAFAQDPTIKFNGVDATGSSLDGYGTGLYDGTLNGTPALFICDDSTHTIRSGDVWNANTWTLSNVATAGHGAFSGSPYPSVYPGYTVQQAYNAVAYLANILFSHSSSDINGIQWAIWKIMDHPDGAPDYIADPGTGAGWVSLALTNDNYSNPSILFYSPDGNTITAGLDIGKTPQEFIGETPEPISMVLMGTFLTLAGLLLGKKKVLA